MGAVVRVGQASVGGGGGFSLAFLYLPLPVNVLAALLALASCISSADGVFAPGLFLPNTIMKESTVYTKSNRK